MEVAFHKKLGYETYEWQGGQDSLEKEKLKI